MLYLIVGRKFDAEDLCRIEKRISVKSVKPKLFMDLVVSAVIMRRSKIELQIMLNEKLAFDLKGGNMNYRGYVYEPKEDEETDSEGQVENVKIFHYVRTPD
ncbi:MAG: hypothetical protein ACREBJ_04300, partial [Nitrosotalea sp.]